jgi:hypothetical protein
LSAEGEGFEPSKDLTALSDFRDSLYFAQPCVLRPGARHNARQSWPRSVVVVAPRELALLAGPCEFPNRVCATSLKNDFARPLRTGPQGLRAQARSGAAHVPAVVGTIWSRPTGRSTPASRLLCPCRDEVSPSRLLRVSLRLDCPGCRCPTTKPSKLFEGARPGPPLVKLARRIPPTPILGRCLELGDREDGGAYPRTRRRRTRRPWAGHPVSQEVQPESDDETAPA